MTDKAVSKWECGNSIPEYSIMMQLCSILGVTANEMLSGARLSSSDYGKKAEENIMTLMQDKHTTSKKQRVIAIAAEAILVILLAVLIIISTNGALRGYYFLDYMGISLEVLFTVIILIAAGKLRDFGRIFYCLVHKKVDEIEKERARRTVHFSIKAIWISGGIVAVIDFISLLRTLTNLAMVGPNVAALVLTFFYSLVASAVLLVVKERI